MPQCPGEQCYCRPKPGDNGYCNGTSVDLFITVIDEQNTPPAFEKLPYYTSIKENLSVVSLKCEEVVLLFYK